MLIGKGDMCVTTNKCVKAACTAVPEWRGERNFCLIDNDVHCTEW